MNNLDDITDQIQEEFETRNTARDLTLSRSRQLIRHCANTIKAVHRQDWQDVDAGLETLKVARNELLAGVADYPDLFYTGYTQDALKELVEAFVLTAMMRDQPLPGPADLHVPGSTYLNGLAEAASELRRSILDIIRQGHDSAAETHLDKMDTIYNALMAFDFPDAITGGLRRRVDQLRGVLQRTRGDLTTSLRQHRLREAILGLERKLDIAGLDEEDQGEQ